MFHLKILNKGIQLVNKPIIICQGAMNLYSQTKSIMDFFKKIPIKEKKMKIINKGYHELYMDREKDTVYLILLEWMKEKIAHQKFNGNSKFEHRVLFRLKEKQNSFQMTTGFLFVIYIGIIIAFVDQIQEKQKSWWKFSS